MGATLVSCMYGIHKREKLGFAKFWLYRRCQIAFCICASLHYYNAIIVLKCSIFRNATVLKRIHAMVQRQVKLEKYEYEKNDNGAPMLGRI